MNIDTIPTFPEKFIRITPDIKGALPIFMPTETESKEGVKFDSEKPPMALVPQEAIYEVARVLGFGQKKYGSWNWAKGMEWSRVLNAIYRHLAYVQQKKDIDDETGLLHSAHAAAGILFLLTYQLKNLGTDDRYFRG